MTATALRASLPGTAAGAFRGWRCSGGVLAKRRSFGIFAGMSTLTEIEAAIEQLPPEQWVEIRRWLESHAPKAASAPRVDWTGSHAVTRQRRAETRLDAGVVMEALAAVRD